MFARAGRTWVGVVLATALVALPAAAQTPATIPTPGADAQNFKPAAGTWNYFSVEGARVAKHGEFVPSLYVHYAHQPLVERDVNDNINRRIIEHLTTVDLLFTVGLFNRLELGVGIPVHHVKGEVLAAAGNEGTALGDIRVTPKLRLYGLERDRGFGIALSAPLSFPTGDKEKFVGADIFTANPKLVLEARAAGFSFAANGGVRLRTAEHHIGTLDLGHEVTYGVGMGVELGSDDALLLAEAYGATPIQDVGTDSRANPFEGLLGLRFFFDAGPVLSFGGGTGFVPDYGSPTVRVFAMLGYHDRRYDRDKDGILDDLDKCPDDPEDKDQFEDTDGCPDPDNDQDGVLDVADDCPIDPEDIDGFEDVNGCPDPDNDQDGILDGDDRCPNEAETFNKWEDTDGCPDEIPDTDGDGLLDPDDQCPKDPEDKDGFEDADGCPDPDNDKDTILDVNDKCPNDAEVFNGFEDQDGCPDEAPPMKVRVTQEKIEILERVYFETNKAKIKAVSYDILNQVAAAMKGHQEIKKVRVEGHTDSQGNDRYNLNLSQKRADSVREYLVGQGIAPARLESMGYGESQPIDTNRTRKGRANNRRVEFTIVPGQ